MRAQPDCARTRLKKLCVFCAAAALVGGAYAAVCTLLGVGIPCVFHLVTRLKCPGCGVSRMCLRLLRLDFVGAWHANAAILCLLPFGAAVAADMAVRYVRCGTLRLSRWANALVWCMVAVLLAFGVWRNLPLK